MGQFFGHLGRTLLLTGGAIAPLVALAVPFETDIPYMASGEIKLGSWVLRQDGQTIRKPDGTALADQLYTAPVSDGLHLCAADLGFDGLGELRCWDHNLEAVLLMSGGRPGRLALGGDYLAWVAAPQSLPQVFVAAVNGSGRPRALTNVDLAYIPGQAPKGFVEPPLRQSLRFDGDWLRWEAPSGPGAVRWR